MTDKFVKALNFSSERNKEGTPGKKKESTPGRKNEDDYMTMTEKIKKK